MEHNNIDDLDPYLKLSLVKIDALNAAYYEACDRKDHITCDKIRMELQRVLCGKKLMITIDSGLNLSADLKSVLL